MYCFQRDIRLHFIASLGFVSQVLCGFQPYYLNFPPPLYPVTNGIESDFQYSTWSQGNSTTTRGSHLPSGPIPLVVHTWVKPVDNSEGTKLQNGTVIYYLGGPWGGIRSSAVPTAAALNVINSIPDSTGSTYPASPSGQKGNTIFITTPPPPPSRQQQQVAGPWGHGHFGFGWPSSTQLYDKLPETTTVATRNQVDPNPSTTTEVGNNLSTAGTTTTQMSTAVETTTTDPVAASTNARFPVSDSVRKFRRIVAQIRAITKKELATAVTTTRRARRLTS